MIEIIIVVALIAFIYSVAIPQFNLRTGVEATTKINQIASDIRNAFDSAVLTGKVHRLVFQLCAGEYWLEYTEAENFYLGNADLDHDLTESEERDLQDAFIDEFTNYEDLLGEAITNPDDDSQIPQTSPVMQARDRLELPRWSEVKNLEWNRSNLGSYLMFQSLQAEHHGRKQEARDLGEEGRAYIYFFPEGYVERAMLHVAYRAGECAPDQEQAPYTILTRPYEGVAEIRPGYEEIDVKSDEDQF